MGSILSGHSIRLAVETGDIEIDPYDPSHINPASYDVTLGDGVAVYSDWVEVVEGERTRAEVGEYLRPKLNYMDVRKPPEVRRFTIDPKAGWILHPGIGYLMHTRERICAKRHVPILDGKSSIGRLFIMIHFTAGFGDPGFDGQFTLEVQATSPIRVYPGMRIGQIRFQTIEGSHDSYQKKGSYRGDLASGPVPSQAWRMFRPEEPSLQPLPDGVRYTNGGKECDALTGPCSCGAWHHDGERRGTL